MKLTNKHVKLLTKMLSCPFCINTRLTEDDISTLKPNEWGNLLGKDLSPEITRYDVAVAICGLHRKECVVHKEEFRPGDIVFLRSGSPMLKIDWIHGDMCEVSCQDKPLSRSPFSMDELVRSREEIDVY